ncbi:hypothetical protein YPPY02_2211, partial [Yersinia pestis PY-02]
MRRRVLRTS